MASLRLLGIALLLSAHGASACGSRACEAGKYCRRSDLECVNCPSGKYRRGIVRGSNCTVCPEGSYCPTPGLGQPTQCKQDFYCPNAGMVEPWECFFGGESERGMTKCKLKLARTVWYFSIPSVWCGLLVTRAQCVIISHLISAANFISHTNATMSQVVLVFAVAAGAALIGCCVFAYRRYHANAEAAALRAYEEQIAAKRRNLENETQFRTNPIQSGGGGGVELAARPSAPPLVNGQ